MSKYKEKFTQITINANKGPAYFFKDDMVVLNLCSCFAKKNNYVKFLSTLKECLGEHDKVNLCNLASMCYKLGIPYHSQDCLDFVYTIKQLIKSEHPEVEIVQNDIYCYGEVDCQPLDTLVSYDTENSCLYLNQVLLDCLKYLGYVSSQVINILQYTKDFNKIVPEDLRDELPIVTKKNLKQYNNIKEILLS